MSRSEVRGSMQLWSKMQHKKWYSLLNLSIMDVKILNMVKLAILVSLRSKWWMPEA